MNRTVIFSKTSFYGVNCNAPPSGMREYVILTKASLPFGVTMCGGKQWHIRGCWHLPRGLAILLLFDRPPRGLLLRLSRLPIVCDNDESNHTELENMLPQSTKEADIHANIFFLLKDEE